MRTIADVTEARRMRREGASLAVIAERFGIAPSSASRWVSGEGIANPEIQADAMALRAAGMPYPAIAIALRHFRGVTVTVPAVRNVCRNAGVPLRPGYADRGQNFRKAAA